MSVLLFSAYLTSNLHGGECWVNICDMNKCISKIQQTLMKVSV